MPSRGILTWLGHATFRIDTPGGKRVYVDPFLNGNPKCPPDEVEPERVDAIFITHLHADHYLGLPGLIKSYEMQDREERLTVYGPPGLRSLFASLGRVIGKPRYGLELVELNRAESVDFGDYEVEPFEVTHSLTRRMT